MKLNIKYLPQNDLVFTIMFLNKELCEKTLEAILGEKINLINIVAESKNDLKKAALNSIYFDIKTKDINGRIITLDLQRKYIKDRVRNRTVYYACREVSVQKVTKGEYEKLKNVVITFLLTEASLKHTSANSEIVLKDCITGEKYSDLFTIYEVNIKHIDENKSLELRVLRDFFEIDSQHDFDKFISSYGETQYGKLLLENYAAAVDNNKLLDDLEKEDKYMIKLSDEERIEIKLDGIKQGKEEGERSKALEIAKELLKNNVPVEVIMKSTNITKEKIEEISKLI